MSEDTLLLRDTLLWEGQGCIGRDTLSWEGASFKKHSFVCILVTLQGRGGQFGVNVHCLVMVGVQFSESRVSESIKVIRFSLASMYTVVMMGIQLVLMYTVVQSVNLTRS